MFLSLPRECAQVRDQMPEGRAETPSDARRASERAMQLAERALRGASVMTEAGHSGRVLPANKAPELLPKLEQTFVGDFKLKMHDTSQATSSSRCMTRHRRLQAQDA